MSLGGTWKVFCYDKKVWRGCKGSKFEWRNLWKHFYFYFRSTFIKWCNNKIKSSGNAHKMSSDNDKTKDDTKSNGCITSSPVSPYRVRTCLPVQQPGWHSSSSRLPHLFLCHHIPSLSLSLTHTRSLSASFSLSHRLSLTHFLHSLLSLTYTYKDTPFSLVLSLILSLFVSTLSTRSNINIFSL